MTAPQLSAFGMFGSVEGHIVSNAEIVTSSKPFHSSCQIFRTKYAGLLGYQELESEVTSGVVTDKNLLKEMMANQFGTAAGLIYAYAYGIQNNELMEAVDFSYKSLSRMSDKQIGKTCANILKQANAHAVPLADHGVDSNTIKGLEMTLANYAAQLGKPRNAIADRSANAKQVTASIKDIKKFLRATMDRQVMVLQENYPVFVSAYFINRMIIDPGTSETRLSGLVTDAATGLPVEGATIKVITEKGIQYGTTNAKGIYVMKTPVTGTCKVEFSHPAYQTSAQTLIEVVLGKKLELDMGLVKL